MKIKSLNVTTSRILKRNIRGMLIKATEWATGTQGQKKKNLPFPEHRNTKNLDFIICQQLEVQHPQH
jgi:hypothetical protein